MTENESGKCSIDTAIHFHQDIGPGLLEKVYEAILANQLQLQGFKIRQQIAIPVIHKGISFNEVFRADIIVGNMVNIELKCVERLNNSH